MENFKRTKWQHSHCLFPGRIWGHAAVLNGNYIYYVSGRVRTAQNSIFKLNAQSLQFQKPSSYPFQLPNRDSHACLLINNRIYVWGGSIKDYITDQLWQFCQQEGWTLIKQTGEIPQKRQGHGLIQIENRWMLLYGGSDHQTIIYNDFYLFDTKLMIWKKITKIVNGIQNLRQNFTINKVSGYVYIFGGHGFVKQKQVYFNDIYKIKLTNYDFSSGIQPQINIKKINYIDQNIPPQRSMHSAIAYQNRYLIIIGGQGYLIQMGKVSQIIADQEQPYILNDVWCFDTFTLKWKKIQTEGQQFNRLNPIANCYSNKIIIYGGMQNLNQSSQKLSVLHLICTQNQINEKKVNELQINTGVCFKCSLIYGLLKPRFYQYKQQSKFNQIKYKQKIHCQLIYSLAHNISNPFKCIGQMINQVFLIGALVIKIKLIQENYLYIHYDCIFWKLNQIQKICYKFNFQQGQCYDVTYDGLSSLLNQYANTLKLASFRLGTTLFCYFRKNMVNICFMIILDMNQQMRIDIFGQNWKTKQFLTQDGLIEKIEISKLFKKCTGHILQQVVQEGTNIFICNMFNYDYNFELSNIGQDIRYNFGQINGEYFLSSYLQAYFLNPLIGRKVFIGQTKLSFVKVSEFFEIQALKKNLKPINIQSFSQNVIVHIFVVVNKEKIYNPISIYLMDLFMKFMEMNQSDFDKKYTGYIILRNQKPSFSKQHLLNSNFEYLLNWKIANYISCYQIQMIQ